MSEAQQQFAIRSIYVKDFSLKPPRLNYLWNKDGILMLKLTCLQTQNPLNLRVVNTMK